MPVDSAIPALKKALSAYTGAVLSAPPGAGKTTRVPLALLGESWLADRRILLLEPRRLAARAAARYMALSLGEQVGETVGYRMRMDTRVGPRTRIEVITEGVLTRMLQTDPALEQVGAVIFDEFHERSLHADLGMALCLEIQSVLREDLRIVAMSATMNAEPVAELLGDVPVIVSVGRAYPVETRYLGRPADRGMEPAVVRAVRMALADCEGDVLVFLPGEAEIRRVEAKLAEAGLGRHVRVAPLYGSMTQEAQDSAIAACPAGERKVVLATSIAETSLTVEGVRAVVDSGLMRVPRFSPRTGLQRLETVTVSRASADQRRGRAGRQGPGLCLRLWSEADDRQLEAGGRPEIAEADLAPLALELAAWGTADPQALRWLDPPPAAAVHQARELLGQLGALDARGAVTAQGKRMAELGLHPRLGHMLLQAIPLGFGGMACELAALLNGRDLFRRAGGAAPDADLRLRLDALRRAAAGGRPEAAAPPGYAVDVGDCRRVLAEAAALMRSLGVRAESRRQPKGEDACGLLLAFAYPDRIAQRREDGRYLLSSGRGAAFSEAQALSGAPYLVAAELDDRGAEGRILLAAPVALDELERHFDSRIVQESPVAWDRPSQTVKARRRERLGVLVLKDAPLADPDQQKVVEALLDGIAQEGLNILPWTKPALQLRERIGFMHRHDAAWPDVSEAVLAGTAEEWLADHLYGMRSRSDLQRLDLASILIGLLSWEQRSRLDEMAPTHIRVPSGSRIPLDYSDPGAPVLAVRLQELFGLADTPCIAGGRVPVTLHLLSPAHRPVQVTRDLSSFWRNTYFEVKKDLKGRYPKHYWPNDPLTAAPTSRAKPRS